MVTERRGEADDKYREVSEALRWRIRDGVYPVGTRIPTQESLKTEFRTSRSVVFRAIRALQAEGWIESIQGSGATVLPGDDRPVLPAASGRREDEVNRVAGENSPMRYLRPYLEAAFTVPDVVLDVYCLSGESINAHLLKEVARIKSGENEAVRSIAMRLMVPGLDIDLATPRAVDEEHQAEVLERQRRLIRKHAGSMCDALRELGDRKPGPEVSVEARTVPMTPDRKLYLLNRSEVLHGVYVLDRRTIRLRGVEVEIVDVRGMGADLFREVKDDDPQSKGSKGVSVNQEWFDSVWEHLAQPATFGDLI